MQQVLNVETLAACACTRSQTLDWIGFVSVTRCPDQQGPTCASRSSLEWTLTLGLSNLTSAIVRLSLIHLDEHVSLLRGDKDTGELAASPPRRGPVTCPTRQGR